MRSMRNLRLPPQITVANSPTPKLRLAEVARQLIEFHNGDTRIA